MKKHLLALIPFIATLAVAAPEADLTPGQLAAAARVFLGQADCDMQQQVSLRPIEDKPGHFELQYMKTKYVLVPTETKTGAVRLEDRQSGIVWLQIPRKSMLLDTAKGSRLVDGCTLSDQRPVVLDPRDAMSMVAGPGFGISGLGN